MDDNGASSTPGNEASFTPNETKLICAIMQNLTAEIQFDVDKVALELGYKNGGSLRARWNSLKRFKISASASTGGVDKATPSKKAKATPKKVKAVDSEEVGEDFYLSPLGKKTGKKGGKGRKIKVEREEEDGAVASVEGKDGVAVDAGGDEEF